MISLEEAVQMEIFINQALIDILISKGIMTHEELTEKLTEIRTSSKLVLAKSSHGQA